MKARKGGNRLERLKNLCEVHGVLLHPEHPSNELVIDCNGNKLLKDNIWKIAFFNSKILYY